MQQAASQQDVNLVRDDLKDHTKDDKEFQGKIFEILDDRFDKLDKRFDTVNTKLDELWDEKNFRDGVQKTEEENTEYDEKKFSRRERLLTIAIALVTTFATIKMSK